MNILDVIILIFFLKIERVIKVKQKKRNQLEQIVKE